MELLDSTLVCFYLLEKRPIPLTLDKQAQDINWEVSNLGYHSTQAHFILI